MLIGYTAHMSYCPSAILHIRPRRVHRILAMGGQEFFASPTLELFCLKSQLKPKKYTKKTTFFGVTNLIEFKNYSFARKTNFNFINLSLNSTTAK